MYSEYFNLEQKTW